MTFRSAFYHQLLQAALATLLSSSIALAQNPRAFQHFKAAPDLDSVADTTNVIVQYNDDAQETRRQDHARRHGLQQMQHSPFGHGHLRRAQIVDLLNDKDVKYVSPNREVSLAHFPPWMLKEAIGYRFAAMTVPERPVQTGKGIGIAIIDSGVAADEYFKDGTCTSNRLVYRQNFVTGETTVDDGYGHGTHVAGILAGTGLCLPGANVDMSGIAREAKIISLRALNARGQGKDSDVIAAIDRAIALKSTYNIRVINLSLGRVIKESFKLDPLCQAVEKAWKNGIVVVVAAGNNGRDNSMGTQGYSTITSPGNDPFVITVGATRMLGNTGREDDAVSSYSSKGPSLLDQVVKPDLVAPGNIVYARMSPSSYLATSYQSNLVGVSMAGGPNVPNIFLLSGTSMAAPVVSGSAALLLQKSPTLTPDQVKARLMKTAWKGFMPSITHYDPTTNEYFYVQHDLFTIGAGYLDLESALASTDLISSTMRALSPRVTRNSKGEAILTTTYPNITGVNVIWGTNVAWGTNVIWGTTLVSGSNVVWGSNVIWGTSSTSGYNVIWGTNVTWGTASPFSESLSVRGDQ